MWPRGGHFTSPSGQGVGTSHHHVAWGWEVHIFRLKGWSFISIIYFWHINTSLLCISNNWCRLWSCIFERKTCIYYIYLINIFPFKRILPAFHTAMWYGGGDASHGTVARGLEFHSSMWPGGGLFTKEIDLPRDAREGGGVHSQSWTTHNGQDWIYRILFDLHRWSNTNHLGRRELTFFRMFNFLELSVQEIEKISYYKKLLIRSKH